MQRTCKDWLLATRPWSFPASFIPVLAVAAYLSYRPGAPLNWPVLMLAIVMMVLFQVAGNLIGDYFDHIKGVDQPGSLNQVRHIQSGKFTPQEIRAFGHVALAAAALTGLALLGLSDWRLIWLGACAVASAAGYFWLKSHALGDLDIFLCYAILPAVGVSYLGTGHFLPHVLLVCLPFGLLTVAILHINNTRDIQSDQRAGVLSLAGLIGARASIILYFVEIIVPYALVLAYAASGLTPWSTLATWLTAPLALPLLRCAAAARRAPDMAPVIASADQRTAQLQLAFGLLYAAGFFLGGAWA